jgi:hypothetical protein
MSSVKLEWTSAEVKDAKLSVGLDGELPDGWKESFERTATLLGDGEWGDIQIKKGKVQVSEVPPGAEEKLRHHLEAIVAQANAHLLAREREAQPDDGRDRHDDEDEPRGPDAEMTERFRAFAGGSHGSESEEKTDGER